MYHTIILCLVNGITGYKITRQVTNTCLALSNSCRLSAVTCQYSHVGCHALDVGCHVLLVCINSVHQKSSHSEWPHPTGDRWYGTRHLRHAVKVYVSDQSTFSIILWSSRCVGAEKGGGGHAEREINEWMREMLKVKCNHCYVHYSHSHLGAT